MGMILISAIGWFFHLLSTALLVRAIMSWFVNDPYSTLGKIYMGLIRFTEPMVEPCRRLLDRINLNTGMLDFSVFLAMILIEVIGNVCINIVAMLFLG